MKKLRFTVMMLAIVAGIGGAFMTKAANHKAASKDDPTIYEWLDADNNPTDATGTVDQEAGVTGCTGTAALCQNAYLSTDFNTTGDQESGLKNPDQMPRQHINRP